MKTVFQKICMICMLSAMTGLFCSCAQELVPYELMQLPKYTPIYTANCFWYTDPMEMTTENVQKGSVLPFGTEVKISRMTEKEICFSAAGKNFKITLEDANFEQMTDFFLRAFTSKTADELAPRATYARLEKMKRGIVEKGMTEQEVLTAYGRPSLARTPILTTDTWIYYTDFAKTKRVLFRKDSSDDVRRVVRIIELYSDREVRQTLQKKTGGASQK